MDIRYHGYTIVLTPDKISCYLISLECEVAVTRKQDESIKTFTTRGTEWVKEAIDNDIKTPNPEPMGDNI
jgi:hypothetical protein